MNEYECEQMSIILQIPKDACRIQVSAIILPEKIKDDYIEVSTVLDSEAIREARNDYLSLDPNDDAFATYAFTDMFKQFLEEGHDFKDLEAWDEYRKIHADDS